MDSLPAELLSTVIELLSDNDVLNLPPIITSRGLTSAAALARYGSIVNVWLEVGCSKRLARIARHQRIANHVTELRFTLDRLQKVSPREYLESQWDSRHPYAARNGPPATLTISTFKNLVAPSAASEDSMALNFVKYRVHLQSPIQMEEREEDMKLLTLALLALPGATKISVDNMRDGGKLQEALGDAWCYGIEGDPLVESGSHLM